MLPHIVNLGAGGKEQRNGGDLGGKAAIVTGFGAAGVILEPEEAE